MARCWVLARDWEVWDAWGMSYGVNDVWEERSILCEAECVWEAGGPLVVGCSFRVVFGIVIFGRFLELLWFSEIIVIGQL